MEKKKEEEEGGGVFVREARAHVCLRAYVKGSEAESGAGRSGARAKQGGTVRPPSVYRLSASRNVCVGIKTLWAACACVRVCVCPCRTYHFSPRAAPG